MQCAIALAFECVVCGQTHAPSYVYRSIFNSRRLEIELQDEGGGVGDG